MTDRDGSPEPGGADEVAAARDALAGADDVRDLTAEDHGNDADREGTDPNE